MRPLSPHFTLTEMTRTEVRLFDNVPEAADVERMRMLCADVLEPLRAEFGPLRILSGYRTLALNTHIGGSPSSAHVHGCAADLVPVQMQDFDGDGDVDAADVSPGCTRMVRWLLLHREIPWDQAISEKAGGPGWLHVGINPPWRMEKVPRHQALTYRAGRTPAYLPFIP